MSQNDLISSDEIRLMFSKALSEMYQDEVPQYAKMLSTVRSLNKKNSKHHADISREHHGAIRLGSAAELSTMRRIFAVMGMHAVDYYDLSTAGIPVHSTAFRPLTGKSIKACPFRVFTSLLRLDLITDDALPDKAKGLLRRRSIFSPALLQLTHQAEKQNGLDKKQASHFVSEAIETFRWHEQANVEKKVYTSLLESHPLIADVVSFKGPHINHLTPGVTDIDQAETYLKDKGFNLKSHIEGPPKRQVPILLRQTSFIALEESIQFSDYEQGTHTARFGEIEQRGIALTPKGRKLYDKCLARAKKLQLHDDYAKNLNEAFSKFPDDDFSLWQQGLAHFSFSLRQKTLNNYKQTQAVDNLQLLIKNNIVELIPIRYEDFLPVSAAGIFQSNLNNQDTSEKTITTKSHREAFENALGTKVIDSFTLYERIQQNSLKELKRKLKKLQKSGGVSF